MDYVSRYVKILTCDSVLSPKWRRSLSRQRDVLNETAVAPYRTLVLLNVLIGVNGTMVDWYIWYNGSKSYGQVIGLSIEWKSCSFINCITPIVLYCHLGDKYSHNVS